MKTKYLFLAVLTSIALVGCMSDEIVGDNSPNSPAKNDGAILFNYNIPNMTRAGEFTGATAAEKLGGMFVVEGTKGSEAADAPSSTVVFDNYLVGYEYNSAGKTESNTNNWEYVGKEAGISGRMTSGTWTSLHSEEGQAKSQTIKYWDYSQDQYDFIAWSTGEREAVTTGAVSGSAVNVTRINTGTTLASDGFTLTAASANDLLQCYYTDINTVTKASNSYGKPVTLTFKNMAAKVRVALYETVPGYSVKDVKFYSSDDNPTAPIDLGTGSSATNAVLFTMGSDVLPQSGAVLVYYPHLGTTHRDATPAQTKDYNKASVTVTPGSSTSPTQAFGALTSQYGAPERNEGGALADGDKLTATQAAAVNTALSTTYNAGDAISAAHATAYNTALSRNVYLGRTLPTATYAGDKTKDFYEAVIPNTNGKPLTLRVDYTLVPIDGAAEIIQVYGAKAVVPATYTVWQPNYAYTYIFKISDNTNGWTSQTNADPQGLFPITFDAVVTNFVDVNAEQTTVTTVATPSITTYQQGHDWKHKDEYSKTQKAGVSASEAPDVYKDLYVQVMDNSKENFNSNSTPTLKGDLNGTNKSLLFAVSTTGAPISEATVMDALQNRKNWDGANPVASPEGRNDITLTTNDNIDNTVTSIINGVDDQPITEIAGTAIAAGQVAKIDIDQLATGTYAYVYCTTVPSTNEKVYHVVAPATAAAAPGNYYEVALTGTETPLTSGTAAAGKVYFVKNLKADGTFDSYTFKQTKVGDDVTGLVEATIPGSNASSYTAGHFYFDVYNRNNGAYAVKVFKVVP